MTTMRERFYELAREALDEDEHVAVVTAQIGTDSIGEHPRHFDVGIREQLMIGVAAGLALEGYRPVAHSYTPFVVERPWEFLKLDLGHNDLGRCVRRRRRRRRTSRSSLRFPAGRSTSPDTPRSSNGSSGSLSPATTASTSA